MTWIIHLGVCDVWVNQRYESTKHMHYNHKWNKWVNTVTRLWLDLLLRAGKPYLCLLYVWVQKQIIDRLREIKYASEGKVPWENFSLWLCLPEKSRERINVLQGITLMFMIGWNTEHQRSPLQKWKSFVDFSWPALAEVGCFDSPLTQRCWAPWTDFHESQARSAK